MLAVVRVTRGDRPRRSVRPERADWSWLTTPLASLPPLQAAAIDLLYAQGRTTADACRASGLSAEEFGRARSAALRAIGAALLADDTCPATAALDHAM